MASGFDNGRVMYNKLQNMESSIGNKTASMQTTYDITGNLTQVIELDVNGNTVHQYVMSYNADGTINTVTETNIDGTQFVTTLNYVNGSADPTNPMTRRQV